jgi:hypothetical protein
MLLRLPGVSRAFRLGSAEISLYVHLKSLE